jgi:hypothetical protein
MKYLKSERVEIQEVYEKYISFIEENITYGCCHLCHIDLDLEKYDRFNEVLNCGWNERMLPNAVVYLKSEQPTERLNRVIWLKPMFKKDKDLKSGNTWWDTNNDSINNIACNREKIEFLQHLIKKLR